MASIAKLIARKIAFPLLVKSGISKFLIKFSHHKILVLNYHGVVRNTDYSISVNHMSVQDFEMQIRYFTKNFNVIGLDEFYKFSQDPESVPTDKKNILITFDDGYENNFKYAFPVLKKYKANATIFPVTGLINTSAPNWYDAIDLTKKILSDITKNNSVSLLANDFGISYKNIQDLGFLSENLKDLDVPKKEDFIKKYLQIVGNEIFSNNNYSDFWKILNKDQIREMSESGLISFGSHTVSHPNLDRIPIVQAKNEINNSKKNLEEIIQKEVISIAFPDGGYNEDIKSICRKAGYKLMFSVKPKCDSDYTDMDIFRRFSVPNTTTTESVIFNTSLAFNKQGVK